MPLSDADILQENSAVNAAGTSHPVTLGSGTTAGNTVIVLTYSSTTFSAIPSGFIADVAMSSLTVGVYRKTDVTAAETSWTFTATASAEVAWYVFEASNIDTVEPLDVTTSGTNSSLVTGGTLSTGTTAQNAGLSVLVLAGFGAQHAAAAASWAGYTNGFEEVADVSSATNTGAALAVARIFQSGTTGTFQTTGTGTVSTGNLNANARLVAYRAADAPLAAPLAYFTSYDFGTHGGMGNNSPSNPLGASFAASGTWGTQYSIGSGFARNSGYGLRIVLSAGTAEVSSPLLSPAWPSVAFGMNVRVVSATGVAHIAYVSSTTQLRLVYDGSTNKFGLVWGTGTVSYQSGTTALNTWVWIDVRARFNSTTRHAEWRIETGTDTYTDQTPPADLSTTAGTASAVIVGAVASSTVTFDHDDFVLSRYYAAYPLGPHTGGVLVPATTGASVVGTAANFNEFTANGTLAAFASTSGQRIDEVPPTISASSDGVVQVTVAASDYMKFPMTDPSLASNEVFAAARAVIPTWGGTGTGTGTLWLAVSDGVTETVIDAGSTAYDGDSLTAASSTYPLWRSGIIPAPSGGWNPTRANALEGRVGKSSDATPDMGVSAFYIEYVKRKAITARQVTVEDPISATADILVNPYTSASVSYLVTNNDATRSVNFNYSISGTPQTPVTVSPSTNQTVTVNADSYGDISDLSLEVI